MHTEPLPEQQPNQPSRELVATHNKDCQLYRIYSKNLTKQVRTETATVTAKPRGRESLTSKVDTLFKTPSFQQQQKIETYKETK